MIMDDWDSFEIFSEDHHNDDTNDDTNDDDTNDDDTNDDDHDTSFNLTRDYGNFTPKKRILTDDEEKKRRLRNRLSAHMSRVKQRNYIEFLKSLIEEKNAIIQFQKRKIWELRKELIEHQQNKNKNKNI